MAAHRTIQFLPQALPRTTAGLLEPLLPHHLHFVLTHTYTCTVRCSNFYGADIFLGFWEEGHLLVGTWATCLMEFSLPPRKAHPPHWDLLQLPCNHGRAGSAIACGATPHTYLSGTHTMQHLHYAPPCPCLGRHCYLNHCHLLPHLPAAAAGRTPTGTRDYMKFVGLPVLLWHSNTHLNMLLAAGTHAYNHASFPRHSSISHSAIPTILPATHTITIYFSSFSGRGFCHGLCHTCLSCLHACASLRQ